MSSTAIRCPRSRGSTASPPLEPPPAARHRAGAPGVGVAALGLAALIATGAPAPIALVALIPGALALGRPRPAFAIQLALVLLWVTIGAGEPGVAALIAVLAAPLLLPAIDPEAIALPGLAPLLGLLGLGPVYPALAGLTRGAASRALLGGIGYLWIAAWEEVAHHTLLLGPVADPPAGWKGSAGTAITDVFAPLVDGQVLAAAGIFAAAALVLPLLVRGRTPLLDALGALIWAAGLISALRLVAGGTSPPGLLFGALLAAVVAALLSREWGRLPPSASGGPLRPPWQVATAFGLRSGVERPCGHCISPCQRGCACSPRPGLMPPATPSIPGVSDQRSAQP